MQYILSAQEYAVFLHLSRVPKGNLCQAVYDYDSLSRSEISQAKKSLFELGLIKKNVISFSGLRIAEAILQPQRVISIVSCNSKNIATAHYCMGSGFWVMILPSHEHSIVLLETPILHEQLSDKIAHNFMSGIDFEGSGGIDLHMSAKEIIVFELMQLALLDKIRKKALPLTKEEAALSISQMVNRKNMLDLAAGALMLGEETAYDISRKLWQSSNVMTYVDRLVQKGVFERVGEGRLRYILSKSARQWLTVDSIVDKITIQKLPEGSIANITITKAGMMRVQQTKDGLHFKSIDDAMGY